MRFCSMDCLAMHLPVLHQRESSVTWITWLRVKAGCFSSCKLKISSGRMKKKILKKSGILEKRV